MTIDRFLEELKQQWSWLYEQLSRFYDRQWAPWELLTIAAVILLLLVLQVRRRRRIAAAAIARVGCFASDPSIIGVRLTAGKRNGDGGEQLQAGGETDCLIGHPGHRRRVDPTEEPDRSDQSVRDLRREIVKRDQNQARLQREISELRVANDQLEREVAGLMAANERLLRQFTEGKRVEELSRP
ncbi:MAG: hypothetical protein ACYSWO_02690 [Planctomycetota bacterium]|jgi:hypothetical protein